MNRVRHAAEILIFFLFILCLVTAKLLYASDKGITLNSLEAYPTFECIGLRLAYGGDSDSNATVAVSFREKGRSQWRQALPLSRIKGDRFAGSIFFLKAGTQYEISVKVTDPAGVLGEKPPIVVSTRSASFPVGGGREYFVDPAGDDQNKGTVESPLATIQKAADLARPGDIVRITPGIYRESVTVRRPGKPGAYISFIARDKGVVLSGADPEYDNVQASGKWQAEGGGVYSTEAGHRTHYLAVDGVRLYHYLTPPEFEEFICGAPGGWYQDENSGRLFVRLSSDADPGRLPVQIGALDCGIRVREADYVLIEGLEIRDYGGSANGAGVSLERSAWCVIRNCSIHGMRSIVEISGARAEGNLVESCELWDTSIPLWPWAMTKDHDEEGGGVMSTGGRGTVVRGCRIHDLYDGLSPSVWDSLWNESYNCDWDVYDNEFYNTRDDVIEPEGPSINWRFWNNVCHDLFTGVSLAPINVGPAYIMYNVLYDENWQTLKYGSGFEAEGMGRGWCFLYHNTICSNDPAVNTLVVSRPLSGQIFRNNIFFASAYPFWTSKVPERNNSLDYNDWYTADTPWFEIWVGTPYKRFFHFPDQELYFLKDLQEKKGWELHGLQADPLFQDRKSGRFRLAPGSPCIDRGEVLPNINDGYLGQAPDLGAFEFGSAVDGVFPLGRRP
ncbi:MAG: hypothetical protein A3F83_01680 [Candidatus Glassbacteria bacterium RIFCSPLOWO2_12_FULL_58_11]|uniref:Right handed beta helix domain-containing protein n=1 Tax=Candidatus Glassbacteria bacterium RIFCSPLOWO2_12_FULL_58_11 TaxID=1817867 RepID=A0A1F5YUU9_9BACT|nr:MAG: hypothetical protein A3F83_01680 [Candidatus Glassbacteria bacterium RIFCSPLOWO2_12_FULL_58_11]